MNTRTPDCPRCRRAMTLGFLADHTRNSITPSKWVEGEPQYGFLGLKVDRKKMLHVTTFRCSSCGYLESYANPQQADG